MPLVFAVFCGAIKKRVRSMANEKNLIPFNRRTESEQREITTKGGIFLLQLQALDSVVVKELL